MPEERTTERTTVEKRTTVVPDPMPQTGSTNINIDPTTGTTQVQQNEPTGTTVRETTVEKTTRER